ncbi:hypothetical protein BDB00DRAFT_912279 [Zychaea mexicana]|uniref:uncharacterized protein n=1 Tax=Zychaea mexicana TaxID=64656 RepID=UPI0022FE37E7|nr:uncharacterized protein BDB00DRAFT_912279 [Zychaea mexicana]KAI9491809.1 hypothetical protein BDB00DRAFT_912279 [Zychaea mexicana]
MMGNTFEDHPMFLSGKAAISPLSQKIGIPLIVYLEDPLEDALHKPALRKKYANRIIRDLMIKLDSGSVHWQYKIGVGTAIVARLDNKPLSVGLLTAMHAYASMLLSKRYGRGDASKVQDSISPDDFKEFAIKFVDKAKKNFAKDWSYGFLFDIM